ncbi:thioredoxin domain-containing protein [Salmonella enterica]|nr:thioredoxin domain-containing protein [Salmonella enterica]
MNVIKYVTVMSCIFSVFVCQSVVRAKEVPNGPSDCAVAEGKQYIILSQRVKDVPEVLEFFSFYCRHCYQFEQEYHLAEQVKEKLSEDVKIVKYHVSSMGPLGYDLTRAWAVAMLLGVEDKIEPVMFTAIQKQRSVLTTGDIRRVFTESGIKGEDYDSAWKSFAVNALVMRQERARNDFRLTGVPVIYVNGLYEINSRGMEANSLEAFTSCYAKTVKQLIGKH